MLAAQSDMNRPWLAWVRSGLLMAAVAWALLPGCSAAEALSVLGDLCKGDEQCEPGDVCLVGIHDNTYCSDEEIVCTEDTECTDIGERCALRINTPCDPVVARRTCHNPNMDPYIHRECD